MVLPPTEWKQSFQYEKLHFSKNLLWENKQKFNQYKNWLELKNFFKKTIKKYLRNIKYFGEQEITTVSVVNFLCENLSKFEPNTLRGQRNALASFCKFLKIHHEVEWDIIVRIIPRVQKKPFPTLTEEEFERLLLVNTQTDSKTNERNNLIAKFFWYIGMRVSELINIHHNDYCQGLLKLKGKNNKIREVVIPEFLTCHFNSLSKDYLFLTRNGKPLTKGQILRNIKKRAKLAGIQKNISLHTFRRSFATNSHNLGVRLDTIKK